jgi:penicillin-binding protein 2
MYMQRSTSLHDEALRRRLRGLAVVILVSLFLLLARTWHLQVMSGDYFLRLSENNRLRQLRIKSLRGKVLDRHGRVLADNRAAYTLMAVPEDLPSEDVLHGLLERLDLETEPAALQALKSAAAFQPVLIQRDLPRDRVAYFAEHRMDFPGLFLEVEPLRSYPYHRLAAHLLGYLGEISESQLQHRGNENYQPGDLLGQYGLERTYETILRGIPGVRQVEVDTFGRETQLISEQSPIPGVNLVLTLDLHLQQLAEQLLEEHTGSIVALDPRNGQILALASSPAFDPNTFATHLSEATWTALASDPRHPLHNRVIQGQYPPGSIFKIITALAALEEGVVTPYTTVCCPGHYVYGHRIYRDWKPSGHSCVSLHQALVQSCDVYFYHVGQELGVDRIARYARAFGLGQASGFVPDAEKDGLIPSTEWKRRVRGQSWYGGETLSVSIGQGYILTTPLQVANLLATLANGGTLYQPYVILRQERVDGTVLKQMAPRVLRQLHLQPEHIAWVKQGLWGVVHDPKGTGKAARHEHIAIAGKTGTAQVVRLPRHVDGRKFQEQLPEQQRDHAWFAAFAPVEDPRIAVVVMIEHAGQGGSNFASLAKTIIQAHLESYPMAATSADTLMLTPKTD